MSWIKSPLLSPATRYEKEALIKAFLLLFISLEVLLIIILYLYYQNQVIRLKNEIFLELKNYSYTLKGKDFKVDIVPNSPDIKFYQLYNSDKEFYIYVPIPSIKDEVLKIIYPSVKIDKEISKIKKQVLIIYIVATVIIAFVSIVFASYSLNPIRRSIQIIDNFVTELIHDINTPLSSIFINLKILKKKYNDEEISRIETAAKQIASLYENMLILSKEREKIQKEIDLKKLITEEVEVFKNNYPDIKIALYLEDKKIKADEAALKRIISNLLMNAFKHNVKNGHIYITLTDDYLEIENSSKPIKNPDRLFERYYRESPRGLGLGLTIVKKLVDELGFRIMIRTTDNSFIVRLYFKKGGQSHPKD